MLKIVFNEFIFLYLINNPFIGKTIETNVEEGQICVSFHIGDKEFSYIQEQNVYQLHGLGDYLGKFDAKGLVESIQYWVQIILRFSSIDIMTVRSKKDL
jgi:hypothetical protein